MLGFCCSRWEVAGDYFFTQHAVKLSMQFFSAGCSGHQCTSVQPHWCRRLSQRALTLAGAHCEVGALQVVGCRRTGHA